MQLFQKQHNTKLLLDDAHGIGVLGKTGAGSCEHFQIDPSTVTALCCPLGKAFGSYGAIVAGSSNIIEQLIQGARPAMYTTALPPALAAASLQSLELMEQEAWRREKLHENIRYFKTLRTAT